MVPGEDGQPRCAWGVAPPEYLAYHDTEWGRPVGDDDRIFEKLCLEGFQAGLSWLTVLRKREGFRRAFAGFSASRVAAYEETDVERLLSDPGIIRHRAKIQASIANARATLALREEGTSLAALVWRHEPPPRRPPMRLAEVPATTAESRALSAELRRRGFRFVGPTTVYAAMQSLGVVNDHLEGCHLRAVVDEERARFLSPA
ncbi:MAG: DNA-3-methyladenine glycosylase I [Acidimicrobiales bacterium]|nr:DNA-3-methyladenine glycosylase I [Acidimicrobiales bacterium]MBO0894042.1 DNA-3-methyladenine glycosylase I [Acidimicrobiales bacterium]